MHVLGSAAAAAAAARTTVNRSRFSIWRELESRADRLASYGALAVGLGVFVAFLVL